MRSYLLPCLFLACACASAAQDDFEIKCNPDGNQLEMNACALADFKRADAALNKQYKQAMARVSKKDQSRLRREQRAWLKQRDSGCKEEAKESEGGSIWPLEYFSCLASVTQKRTEELGVWGDVK